MTDDAGALARGYFAAWRERDFDALRSLLADDVHFSGPFAEIDNADDCVAGLRRMSEIVTDIEIEKVFVDGPDALTWFTLHTSVAPPLATANWSHVGEGRIERIRVTFDARALSPPS